VETFEEEASIDINSLSEQIIALDKTSQITDTTILRYCEELGIKPPFESQKE
jgi:hypothetical protein